MSEIARLVTTEELEKFPDDDYRYELVDGRVVRMSPVGFQHGRIVARLCALLVQHVQGRSSESSQQSWDSSWRGTPIPSERRMWRSSLKTVSRHRNRAVSGRGHRTSRLKCCLPRIGHPRFAQKWKSI